MTDRHPEIVSGSIGPCVQLQRLLTEAHHKVMPDGIFALNQGDFPLPMPARGPLFLRKRDGYVVEQFVGDGPMDRTLCQMEEDYRLRVVWKKAA